MPKQKHTGAILKKQPPFSKESIEVTGKFTGNAKGFGFVTPSDGTADIFIPPHATRDALHGDTITCKLVHEEAAPAPQNLDKPSRTGKITEIVSRPAMVGAFFTDGNQGFVRPVETKIPYVFTVPPKSIKRFGLADGHRVIFSVPAKGDGSCFITEVMGHIHDPGMDVLTLVRQANVPHQFSDTVMEEANAMPETVAPEDIQCRLDLRDLYTFTIDGDDTKDIDDAISFEKMPNGQYKLGVHIADVTHYVRENTALDDDALERGTSIYLADRVIPMLPHRLSSGICSLFPNVDRLALSCLMTVDENGHVVEYEIAETVINSKKRWTYNEVQDVLDEHTQTVGDAALGVPHVGQSDEQLSPVIAGLTRNLQATDCKPCSSQELLSSFICANSDTPSFVANNMKIAGQARNDNASTCNDSAATDILCQMNALRETLRQKRESKGALDFDLPEAKIRVDENGTPISIEPHSRTNATAIIEEFMILCNETIAAHFLSLEAPFVYRTHEPPGVDKAAKLGTFTKQFGFKTPGNLGSPIALQRLLNATANSAFAQSIASAVLHSLPQARYTPDNPAHYGLASDAYCHFTSPIRRYADLQVHRIIKAWLAGAKLSRFDDILPAVCAACSTTERIAETLEREVTQMKKVEFMSTQTGQNFDATVSGVTAWGVYVMLANTVEGIIPFDNLRNNRFAFDKEKSIYVRDGGKGRSKKKSPGKGVSLRHGDKLTVRLVSADENERKLVFSIAQKF